MMDIRIWEAGLKKQRRMLVDSIGREQFDMIDVVTRLPEVKM